MYSILENIFIINLISEKYFKHLILFLFLKNYFTKNFLKIKSYPHFF